MTAKLPLTERNKRGQKRVRDQEECLDKALQIMDSDFAVCKKVRYEDDTEGVVLAYGRTVSEDELSRIAQ